MCCVCVSRRGMVYFGSSIHIFVTLILFLGSSFRAYRISSYEREENSKHLFGATLIAIYFFTLLVLGCLIFRGVEHKSPKMLGWSGGTFITLETFAFVFNLVLLSPMGGAYDEYGIRNFGFTVDIFQIVMSLLFLGCMAGYCVAIILYILKLREDSDSGSEYTYGEFDDAGTIPAPPVTTNLSRSSTAHSNYSVHQHHNNKSSNTQLNQIGNQYHSGGQNHLNPASHKSSPQLQDRRITPRVNHLSQDGLNENAVGSHYMQQQPQHQPRPNPYGIGVGGYANYPQQSTLTRGVGTSGGSASMPYRQSQTLPHPHHYHRQMPTVPPSVGVGGGVSTSTQFPSRSRMDLASLTQTLTRNTGNMKRVVVTGATSGGNPGILSNTVAGHGHSATSASGIEGYEGDSWQQPNVQALKYTYGSSGVTRKGVAGIEV